MAESYQRRLEIQLLWGRDSLGEVLTNTSGALVLTESSFCPTLWLGLQGAVLEAFTAKTGGSQHNTDLTITNVDVATRTVTVSGTSTAVVAGDFLYFKSSRTVGHIGLMSIAKNTGSLFGIDASVYPTWKANQYDVGTSAITLGKLLQSAALSANKGCTEKLKALVPISAFQSLVSDEAALRQYSADYSESGGAKNGFKKISFFGASGEIEVVPYHFMKAGEFLVYPDRWTYLIGSSEMTYALAKDGDMIFDLEASSAKEIRLFSDLQIFCERPGYLVYGSRSDGKALSA
jgi:hypothetical protein